MTLYISSKLNVLIIKYNQYIEIGVVEFYFSKINILT